MAIKINDIPPEGITLELEQNVELFDQGLAAAVCTGMLSIAPARGGVLHIEGRIQAAPILECSRCLRSFNYPIDTEIHIDLMPATALGTAPEHELDRSELDTEFYQGEEFNPLDVIKEQFLISIPMVPLHRPDCKGLCPVCGTDLNETDCGCGRESSLEPGAFSGLKDFFKK